MATNVTTYNDISPAQKAYAVKTLLERGQALLVLERWGQMDPQPLNETLTRTYRRYNSLARATSPIADGVPPVGQKLTCTDLTMSLEQYSDVVRLTRRITSAHPDPVLKECATLCGEAAAETIEEIRYNILKAGSTVFYAGGVTSRATVNSPATRGDFRKIYRFFKTNKARELTEIVSASVKIATEPIPKAYFAVGHTDLDADLRAISGFIPVQNYSDSAKALPGEIGTIEQFRIVLSEMYDPWTAAGASGTTYLSGGIEVSSAASCDVYPMLFIAANSYAIVPLKGYKSAKLNILPPGTPTKDDPNGDIGFVSWSTYQGSVILNQSWLARLEAAATADPS